MSIPNSTMIAITELKHVAERELDYPARVEKVMAAAVTHWMVVDEGEQFRAACGALILTSPDHAEEIKAELRILNALSAAMTPGVTLDLEALVESNRDIPKPTIVLREAFRAALNRGA